ncbi:MAG TPA: zinc-dependent metalloprotease [Acidimicrobiales bacterium]
MSDDQPPEDPFGNDDDQPFHGVPFFGDLAKMFSGQGPVNWDLARQMAQMIATEGQAEANVDPTVRMAVADLVRVAEMRVEGATGLSTSTSGHPVEMQPVRAGQWASQTLEDWRPLLERLAQGLSIDRPGDTAGNPSAALMGGLFQMIGPMMLGMQSGMMVGHLARRSFGQYDLPLPRARRGELLLLTDALDGFATDWSLPLDEVRLWICIHELTHHAVLGRPGVRDRIEELVGEYVSSFDPDANALDDRLAGLGPELLGGAGDDPAAVQKALQDAVGDPEVLLGAIQSDHQRALLPQLGAVISAIVGYVDWVLDEVGPGLISSYEALTEALRRRRVETASGDRFVERLLGLEMNQATYERGEQFIAGVVERSGAGALSRLWEAADLLPTPAEIEAPGLWLARIDLPADD